MIHPLPTIPTASAVSLRDAISPSSAADSRLPGMDVDVYYTLQASTALPSVDCTKSVKRVVLRGRLLERFNWFQRSQRHMLSVSFGVGLALACAGPFLDPHVAKYVAVASCFLVVGPLLVSYAMLRFDLVVLLATSYEFWYFTVVSLTSNTLMAVNLGDLRACAVVGVALMCQFALLGDANTRSVKATIGASCLGAVALFSVVALQELQLLKGYSNVQLASYSDQWTLSASDVVANGLSNVHMVLLRNAYRKWRAVYSVDHQQSQTTMTTTTTSTTVRCITYRTPLRFVPVAVKKRARSVRRGNTSTRILRVPSSVPALSAVRIPVPHRPSQMRLVPMNLTIHAHDLIQRWVAVPNTCSHWTQRCWTAVGVLGLLATAVSTALDTEIQTMLHTQQQQRGVCVVLAVVGLCSTAAYTLRCVVFHNRRLLSQLRWSFDFLFLMLQSYVSHIVLCHLLQWEAVRCLRVVASLQWMHWIVTLDLLTPLVRKRLGIESPWLAMGALVLQLLGHIFLGRELLFRRQWQIEDRVLVQFMIAGKIVKIHAIPFLLTRMVTTFCWCARLLWRLWGQSPEGNDLILIQGAVEYDDYGASPAAAASIS